MKTTIAKKTASTAIALALVAALVPAPAIAEVVAEDAPVDEAPAPAAVDDIQPEDATLEPVAAEPGEPTAQDVAQDEAQLQVEEPAEDAAVPEASDEPMALVAQSSNPDANMWSDADTKLIASLLSAGTTMTDVTKLFLSGGSVSSMLNGGRGLISAVLKWTTPGGEAGTTMYDIMDKIQAVNSKMCGVEARIDNVALGVSLVNTRDLLESVADLNTSCAEVEEMFDEAHLAKLGIGPLPANATDEEANAWRESTVQAMLKASKDRDPAGFIQLQNDMDRIKQLFTHVSNAASESSATNPIAAWDSYWTNYYNWETEGWGARQALRTSVSSTLVRAYGLLAVYLQIYKDPDHTETALTKQLTSALTQIGSMDAGMSPQEARAAMLAGTGEHVWSPTLKKYATGVQVGSTAEIDSQGHGVPDSDIDAYVRRLHGMNVEQDLILAGVVSDSGSWVDTITVGMAYQGSGSDGTYNARILYWDGHYGTEKTQWTDVWKNTKTDHQFVWLKLVEK